MVDKVGSEFGNNPELQKMQLDLIQGFGKNLSKFSVRQNALGEIYSSDIFQLVADNRHYCVKGMGSNVFIQIAIEAIFSTLTEEQKITVVERMKDYVQVTLKKLAEQEEKRVKQDRKPEIIISNGNRPLNGKN